MQVTEDAWDGDWKAGRSSRTRSLSTVSKRVQPIHSATTVAGIVGHARNNSRMRGSAASMTDPRATRWWRGGPSAAKRQWSSSPEPAN